jgi:hypothetical protein
MEQHHYRYPPPPPYATGPLLPPTHGLQVPADGTRRSPTSTSSSTVTNHACARPCYRQPFFPPHPPLFHDPSIPLFTPLPLPGSLASVLAKYAFDDEQTTFVSQRACALYALSCDTVSAVACLPFAYLPASCLPHACLSLSPGPSLTLLPLVGTFFRI